MSGPREARIADHAIDTPVASPLDDGSPEAGIDLLGLLSSVQETAYLWDIRSDRIDWESNALEVLGLHSAGQVGTGADFQFLIAPEHVKRRQDAILKLQPVEGASGAPYRVQYRFTPAGRRSDAALWLEDHGRCWFDQARQPVRARGVIRVINERYWEEQRLLYRSDHDELTGQLNRIRLTEALGAVVTRAERTKHTCAFLMIAVNNLAVINETFGFDVGDEVIASVAKTVRKLLRGGDSIGRYSSNKFGIILNDCSPVAMRTAADRFMKAVRELPIKTAATQLSATVSVGGVIVPDQAQTVHQALSHALQALDLAKARRSDSFMAFEPSAVKETARLRNITIADEVIAAIDENRMRLALQPIVDTATREPALYECLLRMEKPNGLVVSAGEFIVVAEQLGLSRLIDRRTLELAVELLKKHPTLALSLNVSSLTSSDHDWLVALHRLTGGRRQLTSRLTIEITETSAIHDIDQTVAFVDTLKELGCRVAIDDFGAGYTSFKNLKHLKVDMVKIDGSFVKNLTEDPTNRVFIRALVDIARTFGMATVAEWVADEPTVEALKDAGITHLQGFLFGQPLDPSELYAARR
ncbi:MAG TPA: bifunctional diguanylate cyclase/phosphodiesterase [Hyphomicrobiaceae bacterium]|nr:bifunctional diguanylate cyclase/phosphodiesterase [Hyphomicrobiaceae bacterium]